MALLHGLPQTCSLLLERCRSGNVVVRRSEKPLRTTIAHCRRRRRASTGRETRPSRNHGQITRHHTSSAQLRAGCGHSPDMPSAEVRGIDSRKGAGNVVVMKVRDVGEAVSAVQRCETTETVKSTTETNRTESAAVSTPPRMEVVARPNGKPAEAAPTAIANSEAEAAAPSKERYVRGGPERVIANVNRTRPPGPRIAVREPAAIVIGSPSPWLITNPRPSVVGLICPTAITIWNPAVWLIRHPDVAIVRHIPPIAVRIKVLRSGVVVIGVPPGTGIANQVIAIAIPAVPVVAIRSLGNLILRRLGIAAHRSHISGVDLGAALGGSDLRFALAHDHDRVAVAAHFNPEHAIVMRRMDRHVRSVDFRLGFTIFRDRVVGDALAQLNLDILFREVRDIRFAVRSEAKGISEIELQLSARIVSGGNLVAGHYRLIQCCRRPIAGVTALRRYIPVHQTDAGHTLVGLRGSFARGPSGFSLGWLGFVGRRVGSALILTDRAIRILSDFHGGAGLIGHRRTFFGRLRKRADRQHTRER